MTGFSYSFKEKFKKILLNATPPTSTLSIFQHEPTHCLSVVLVLNKVLNLIQFSNILI